MSKQVFATKKNVPKVAAKTGQSEFYKDGKCFPDDTPHELLLAGTDPTLPERVADLTRLSRTRRMSIHGQVADRDFEEGLGIYEDMPDEGITPYELEGGDVPDLAEENSRWNSRVKPAGKGESSPAKQSATSAQGGDEGDTDRSASSSDENEPE